MKRLSLILYLFWFVLPLLAKEAFADQNMIEQLTRDIAVAQGDNEKSKLHIYRARNYKNMGEIALAEKDYDAALIYDHKGWIHLERGRFYLTIGDNEQARKEAIAAQKETPTLKSQAQVIIKHAKKKIKKQEEADNPKEIYLTKRWEVTNQRRVTSSSPKSTSVRKAYYAKNKQRAKSTARPRRARS